MENIIDVLQNWNIELHNRVCVCVYIYELKQQNCLREVGGGRRRRENNSE
jgi:hypothetical protein